MGSVFGKCFLVNRIRDRIACERYLFMQDLRPSSSELPSLGNRISLVLQIVI